MVKCDDLVYGTSRAEVRSLMGRPDGKGKHGKPQEWTSTYWSYNVGIAGSWNSDYPPLTLTFGLDGTVTEAEVSGYIER